MSRTPTRCFSALVRAVLIASAVTGEGAGAPSVENLLPSDTLAILTTPNGPEAKAHFTNFFAGQFWLDPAMKAFREKFRERLYADWFGTSRGEIDAELSQCLALAQGQVTLALVQNGWDGLSEQSPALLFLMEAKDQSAQLQTNLVALTKSWTNAGHAIKIEKIRGVEFATFIPRTEPPPIAPPFPPTITNREELSGVLRDFSSARRRPWLVGQTETLLLASTSSNELHRLLARLRGASTPCLADQTNYARSRAALARDAQAFAWVNVQRLGSALTNRLGVAAAAIAHPDPNTPQLHKLVQALGLAGFESVAFNARSTGNGTLWQWQLRVPEAQRKGLFKILAPDAKACDPPPFVPADAVRFYRLRLDLRKGWSHFTNSLTEMFPAANGVLKLLLDNAGKDLDLGFDFRTNLIGNLGDDVIAIEKKPRTNTLAALKSPPQLLLVSARNAAELAASLRALTSILPTGSTHYQERNFLGRKIYAMTVPNVFQPAAPPFLPRMNYAALSNYVVFANDAAALEEYLRAGEAPSKALRDLPGLTEAAEHVGGMNTGFFSFENQEASTRTTVELLKRDPAWLAERVSEWPLATIFGLDDAARQWQRWCDFSLLPPYENISKYFPFAVSSASVSAEGFTFKIFVPAPTAGKK